MKSITISLLFLSNFIVIISFAQNKETVGEKFMRFLNNYDLDSLSSITTDNFQLVERYDNYTFNKKTFLDTFVLYSKSVNGKFKILKIISKNNPTKILAEDQNDYAKYLNPKSLTWIITISINNDKIQRMISDTTRGYYLYLDDFIKKHDLFLNWLHKNYPEESEDSLYKNKSGLLTKRLQEYSVKKNR